MIIDRRYNIHCIGNVKSIKTLKDISIILEKAKEDPTLLYVLRDECDPDLIEKTVLLIKLGILP